jgi:hypothetical protein
VTKGKGESSYYSYYSTKQQKSSKKSKKEKSFKAYGKGYSYDDDYVYPTFHPTKIPTPTIPTMPPSLSPNISRDPQTPKPTSRPTPSKPPTCGLSSDGLYGQNIGLANEFRFLYQTEVIPSVSVPELNLDMLPKVEVKMGNDLLPKLFPAECSTKGSVNALTGRSPSSSSSGSDRKTRKTSVVENHSNYDEDEDEIDSWDFVSEQQSNTYIFGNENKNNNREQRRRELQFSSLNGMSIKPRDTVKEDGKK